MAGIEVGDEVELLGEGLEEVGGGVAVVVVAAAALGHLDHQLLVEVPAEAIGRRRHATLGRLGAQRGDAGGVGDIADIGVAVGKQDDAGEGGCAHIGQQLIGAGLPAAVQVGRAAGMHLRQRVVERPAVAHRLRRGKGADAVIEDHQRSRVGRLQRSTMWRAQRTASTSGGPDIEPERSMTRARW